VCIHFAVTDHKKRHIANSSFVFDLDGTICFKGQPLSPAIAGALDFCRADGHDVIVASARPIRDVLPVLPRHLHTIPMVGGNGTFVARDGRIAEVTPLDEPTWREIRRMIEEYRLTYLIDGRWDYAYTGSEDHPISRNVDPGRLAARVPLDRLGEIVKVVLFPESREREEILFERLRKLPVKLYRHHQEEIIDICPQGTDKWQGLRKLGVEAGTFVAFGNDANDVPMFAHAKESVCVGRHEQLRSIATVCVEPDEREIAEVIAGLSAKYARNQER